MVIHHASHVIAILLDDERPKRQPTGRGERPVHLFGHELFQPSRGDGEILNQVIRAIDPESPAIHMHLADAQRRKRLIPALGEHRNVRHAAQTQHLRGIVGMQRIPVPKDALKDVESGRVH